MRRALPLLAILLAVSPAPLRAQEEGAVTLVLLQQTASATPEQPFEIRIGSVNDSATTYKDLQLTVAVYSAIGSRSEFEQTLTTGAISPVDAQLRPVRGPLAAGEGRSFPPISLDLAALSVNALHPVTVELRADGGVTPLAVLRTSVVFISEKPEVPLNVSVSFVIDEPIRVRPDGVLLDDSLEQTLAPGGRLSTIVGALEANPIPVTLAISPLLLEEIQAMGDGYKVQEGGEIRDVPSGEAGSAAAIAMLGRLRVLARQAVTEVVALPYASPSIPALSEAGLGRDLERHIERGKNTVRSVLGVEPSVSVFRPPASALSDSSLDVLSLLLGTDGQSEALLVDPEVLEPPTGLTLSPPAVAAVRTAGGEVPAIAPDPILEARTEASPDDPALAAMTTIGELSALYFEQPSVDRGAAIIFSEDEEPETELLNPLLRSLRPQPGVSWLRPMSATRVLFAETSPQDPPLETRRLQQSGRAATIPVEVLSGIDRADESLDNLISVHADPALVEQVRRDILVSESRYFLGREDLALTFLASAQRTVSNEFEKIRLPDERSKVTLTSQTGVIPITIRNEAGYPVRVRVALQQPKLDFVNGSQRTVTLEPPGQEFSFRVRAQTTGRFPVLVELQTPDGVPIGSSTIRVRSTAYNRIALVITIGAAVFLALWWGRRFLPRRRA